MQKRKTKFSKLWLKNPEYDPWLSKKSEFVGSSSYYCEEIDVSNMGETALKSDMKSKKLTERKSCATQGNFFQANLGKASS